jgi:hypothetical protein
VGVVVACRTPTLTSRIPHRAVTASRVSPTTYDVGLLVAPLTARNGSFSDVTD